MGRVRVEHYIRMFICLFVVVIPLSSILRVVVVVVVVVHFTNIFGEELKIFYNFMGPRPHTVTAVTCEENSRNRISKCRLFTF